MLFTLTLLAGLLSGPAAPAPAQTAPLDTTRQFRGYANLNFAWGSMELRKGKRVRAYLPTTHVLVLESAVPYYPEAPGPGPLPRPKLVAAATVRWLRVGDQYWELLRPNKNEEGSLAQRLQAGPVELFRMQTMPPPILTALGPNPVMSSPADATQPDWAAAPTSWYLRRAGGPPVLVAPSAFASQVAGFLNDDPELAKRVASSQAGYRYEELEHIIQQYNQRARH